MANNEINVRHKLAYKTFADWYEANLVLLMGELSFVSDLNNIYKIGDGETSWRELPFDNAGGVGTNHFYWKFNEDTESVSLMFRDIIITVGGDSSSISVTDALAQDALSLQVAFTPTQDGTPSIDSEPTTEPYLSKVIPRGNKEYYSLVGGTVAWNQMINLESYTNTQTDAKAYVDLLFRMNTSPYTIFYATKVETARKIETIVNVTNTCTAQLIHTGSTRNITFYNGLNVVNGHKYWMSIDFTGVDASTVGGITARYFMLTDLTLMFANNPAIADYAYSLEQATAGSGIAWLKSYGFFTKDYYPYNPGELISVKTSGKKIVGFNQWDERCELGSLNTSTGAETSSSDRLRTKNYIPISPNTAYYTNVVFANRLTICYYDANKDFISSAVAYKIDAFVTPTNARYMRFYIYPDYGKVYHDDICINISDPQKNGTYKPYVTNTYPIDPTDLRGLFKLDSANKLYCEGDMYKSDGTVTRDFYDLKTNDSTTFGNVNFGISAGGVPYLDFLSIAIDENTQILSNRYMWILKSDTGKSGCCKSYNTSITVYDSRFTDATQAVQLMASENTEFIFKKRGSTTETTTPYTSPIDVEAGGTEEFVDSRTVPIPVGNETYYASEYAVHGKTGVTVSHGATQDDPNPTEHEVEFTSQGTVYGGTVDIVSGVLTVTWTKILNPSTENWAYSTSNGSFYLSVTGRKTGITNLMCNRYPTSNAQVVASMPDKSIKGNENFTAIYVKDSMYSGDVTAFKASLADVMIVYELATPLTYQLTSQQVQMLLGDNYLETEDGMIKLTYKTN